MSKKIFWVLIVVFVVFDLWLAVKMISKRTETAAEPVAVQIKTGQEADPAAATGSGQASAAVETNNATTVALSEPKSQPAPAKKISTKSIKDLKTALATGLPVIVKLGSDSCYPCKLMKPILKDLAKELDGKIVVLDLDINENQDLARQFRVNLIPTVIFYDQNGQAKSVHAGYLDKDQLLGYIDYLGWPR